jgi:cytoplasmic iron level regulating protein YaaA (DUF328/UPF0246 family)
VIPVLVLLPPSETKASPTSGPPVDLATLSHPGLADARARVADTLAKVSAQRNAMRALGAGASLAAEVSRNTTIWDNPAAFAARIYTGVLYDAAGMASWSAASLDLAADRVRIISALWGALSPTDLIPAYRLSMATSLARIGPLASYWSKHLHAPLEELAAGGLVVDCRSSSYISAWRPSTSDWVAIRVMRELNGKRAVVSHMAKHTRGLLTGHLVTADAMPTTAQDVADAAAHLIGSELIDVELSQAARAPDVLTLIIAG